MRIWVFKVQKAERELKTCVDADFAGCLRTRRSTSGGLIMHGSVLLQHWWSTQTTVALPSSEAELTGICRGSSKGIGTRSPAADLMYRSTAGAVGCNRSDPHSRASAVGQGPSPCCGGPTHSGPCQDQGLCHEQGNGAANPACILANHVETPTPRRHLERISSITKPSKASSTPRARPYCSVA